MFYWCTPTPELCLLTSESRVGFSVGLEQSLPARTGHGSLAWVQGGLGFPTFDINGLLSWEHRLEHYGGEVSVHKLARLWAGVWDSGNGSGGWAY